MSSSRSGIRNRVVVAVVLGALGLLVAARSWTSALGLSPERTGARVVSWVDADGEPVAHGCWAIDFRFRFFIDGDAVWFWCRDSDRSVVSLARMEPARGRGELRWPLPPELSPHATDGLFPGPDGQLGIVYHTDDMAGPLALAIAGRDGWTYPPTALLDGGAFALLGGAWVGDVLEVVVSPAASDPDTPPVPVIVPHTGEMRRPFEACAGFESCAPAQRAHYRDGQWHLALRAYAVDADGRDRYAWWVDEQGRRSLIDFKITAYIETDIDFVISGILHRGWEPPYGLRADGSLSPIEPSPEGTNWESKDFVRSDDGLMRRPIWVAKSARAGTYDRTYELDGRRVMLGHEADYYDTPPTLSLFEPGQEPGDHVIAHTPSSACRLLIEGAFVDAGGGDHFLVSENCYLRVDAELRRRDPLGLREHLRRRGSEGLELNEQKHFYYLAWAMGGLPICVLVAVLIGVMIARRRKRERVLPAALTALSIGFAVYVISGYVALSAVAPLLR